MVSALGGLTYQEANNESRQTMADDVMATDRSPKKRRRRRNSPKTYSRPCAIMADVYIALGSNMDSPHSQLDSALEALAQHPE